jgi:hypothetical protein
MKTIKEKIHFAFAGHFEDLEGLLNRKGFFFYKLSDWSVSFKKTGEGKGLPIIEIYWNRKNDLLKCIFKNFPGGKGYGINGYVKDIQHYIFTTLPDHIEEEEDRPLWHWLKFILMDRFDTEFENESQIDGVKKLIDIVETYFPDATVENV